MMGSALGIALIFSSAAWATSIPFTGESNVGFQGLHDLFLNGAGNVFTFGNGTVDWSIVYKNCGDYTGGCDLSYGFEVLVGNGEAFFNASDGTTSADNYSWPAGTAAGLLTWTAKPLTAPPAPGTVSLVLPITLSGEVKAWTAQEMAAHSAPFFDYRLTGTGTLTVYLEPGTNFVFRGATADFSGFAEPVPEPASWRLVLCAIPTLAWLRLRRRPRR
jgi:hypothetical protein